MWEPQHLTTLWASKACYRDNFYWLLKDFFLVADSPDAWYGGGSYDGPYPSHEQDARIYQDGGSYYNNTSVPAKKTRSGELQMHQNISERRWQ
jgi:hypothetical protein